MDANVFSRTLVSCGSFLHLFKTESELVQWISSGSETMAFAEVILLNPAAWLP